MIIWLIGLSGSGKTTIGRSLYERLKPRHANLILVDGDDFRKMMGHDLGFSYKDRQKNARRFSHFCSWLDQQEIHLICCVLSNYPEWQKWNRENFRQYFEIYVETSLETLKERDTKGLYNCGEISNVVGVDIPFTPPQTPEMVINNDQPAESVEPLVDRILKELPEFN